MTDEPEISFTIETMLIEHGAVSLWVEFEVIPPPVDEEFIAHRVIKVRLNDEEGPDITDLYSTFNDLAQFVNDAITTELN